MPVSDLVRPLRPLFAALVVAFALIAAPVGAQTPPGNSQSGSGSNPTAQSVTEEQLFQELDRISGRITIPDAKAALLEQPQGRDYRGFRETWLPWIGGIAVLGMLVALVVFYLVMGRIRTDSGFSGIKILRFNVLERFTHWMTAASFIVLALTGLNYIFGKRLLMPLLGVDAFAAWTQWAKYAHNFVSWPFMLGVLIMIVVWIWDNLPDRYDANWLRKGGGFFNESHPPAARFNAGQKLIFWAVALGGIALSVTGLLMLFPFSLTDINGMQIAQYIHATVGVLLIAAILGHIYIGTLGMEGAYEAMGTGEVDLNWAKEHHSVWVEQQGAKTANGPQLPQHGAATPAE